MDMTPSGLARIAGVILAMVALYLHFTPYGATAGFWLMGLAYLVSALFAAAMVELNPQPLPQRER